MNSDLLNFELYIKRLVPISDDSFKHALEFADIKKVKKKNYILRQGSVCKSISFVSNGLFRNFYLKDGVEINTCFCMENDLATSLNSLLENVPSSENIQAIEDSTIITLSYNDLLKLYSLDVQWQKIGLVLTEKECLRLSKKAKSESFESAKNKYLNLLENEPQIIKRVPIQHIASYLGTSRETISRIRSDINM